MIVVLALLLVTAWSSAEVTDDAASRFYVDIFAVGAGSPEDLMLGNLKLDIYKGPVIFLAPDHHESLDLVAYFAGSGLRSVVGHENFITLLDLLIGSEPVYGLIISQLSLSRNLFPFSEIVDFVLPDNYLVSDLVQKNRTQPVPVVYLAPRNLFNEHRFVGLNHIFRFKVTGTKVEPVTVQRVNDDYNSNMKPRPLVNYPFNVQADEKYFLPLYPTNLG